MTSSRRSGILLHPTSLPGPFGSGDLGESAYHFVDWLHTAGQRLWQVLPLGGIGPGNSPYMSSSAFAGNVLLVDIASPGAEPEVSVHRVGVHRWIRLERTLSVSSDLDRLLQELGGLDENAVIDLDVSGQLDLADQQRLQHAVDQLAARHRSFTFNDDDLHLEPSDEDIVGLGADGYVGEVIATLREQQKEDSDEAVIARDALAILAALLREHGREASR